MKKRFISRTLNIFLLVVGVIFMLEGCAGDGAILKERSVVHRKLGEFYLRGGDNTFALKELLEAKRLNPDDAQIYNMLGLTYFRKKDTGKATESFKKALELDPESSQAHNHLGLVYMVDLKRWDDAILEFKKALSNDLYGTPERAYCNMGWAYYNLRDIGKAIENYKKALEIAPEFVLPYYNLGLCYRSVKETSKAVEAFKLALKYDPTYVDAHYQLGLLYFDSGERREAKKEFEEVVNISPPGETLNSARRYLDLLE